MGIGVYSLPWVMQDLNPKQYGSYCTVYGLGSLVVETPISACWGNRRDCHDARQFRVRACLGFSVWGLLRVMHV